MVVVWMYLVLFLRVSLAVHSDVWFLVWCGLEFSVLSFLLYISWWSVSSRKILLYFVSQIFGRFLLITSSLVFTYSTVSVVLVAAVIYKIGFVPGNL